MLLAMIKSVSIAGQRIPIRYKDLQGEAFGQYLPDDKVIEIDKAVAKCPISFKVTLRHEMMEATLFLSGLGWGDVYEQEPIVRAIDEIFWPAWDRVSAKLGS